MLPAIIVFNVWHPGQYFGAGGWRGGKAVAAERGLVDGGMAVEDVEMSTDERGPRRHQKRSRSGRL